jgi:hypothetical protein
VSLASGSQAKFLGARTDKATLIADRKRARTRELSGGLGRFASVPSRNDQCTCGSGRKYKRCCLRIDHTRERAHGRLVDEVTAWAEEQWPGQIAESIQQYQGDRPPLTEEEINFAASWFLHDRDLPSGGTPLERYAMDGPDLALRALALALAPAKLSLWRVTDVTEGAGIELEPYVGGDRVRVRSANISRVVGQWDMVLGRLRPDVMELWGPSRCYSIHHEQALQELIEQLASKHGIDPSDVDHIVRRSPAELLSFRGPEPQPFTTEGDPVVFVRARWRISAETAVAAFDETEWLLADGPDGSSYGWLGDRQGLLALKPDDLPAGALTLEHNPIGMPDVVALGTFYVESDEVRFEGPSQRRLGWALQVIADMLPGAELVDVETRTVKELRREEPVPSREALDVAPEVIAEVRASMTERWLSEPVPALEGLTPRQAASSPACRSQLRSLLRGIAALSQNKLAIDIDTVVADLGLTP